MMATKKSQLIILWLVLVGGFGSGSALIPLDGDLQNVIGRKMPTTADILESRGFLAETYSLPVQGGQFTVSLTRGTNPLFNNGTRGLAGKNPILFLHGLINNANSFKIFSNRVRPKDLSGLDVASKSLDELRELFKDEPSAETLAFLALNIGYEIWMLNRRSTLEARKAHLSRSKGGDSFNTTRDAITGVEDWKFTLDDQAIHDFSDSIDCVLNKTRSPQLIIVGFSAGSTISLMGLAHKPELANKISKAILLAPVFDLPQGYEFGIPPVIADLVLPVISRISVATPSQLIADLALVVAPIVCRIPLLKTLICDPASDFVIGRGTSQIRLDYYDLETNPSDPSALFEATQYIQANRKLLMHKFDFMNEANNIAAYNQSTPPIWDISRIKLDRMVFFLGNSDAVASIANFNATKQRLTVPFKQYFVDGSGLLFNHLAFQIHKDIELEFSSDYAQLPAESLSLHADVALLVMGNIKS